MAETANRSVSREQVLAYVLCALFVGFFVAAEVLGGKLFRFTLFGLGPDDIGLGDGGEFAATAGILAFPLTFVMTDIVNEYFGKPLVKLFTWIAIAVNLLLQPVIRAAIAVPAISFTPGISDADMQRGFEIALGQTTSIVVASLCAFALAQWLDVQVFTWLRRNTGGRFLWLRAQGSTVVSQLIDTLIVIYLAFYTLPALGGDPHMGAGEAGAIALTNYVYKFALAVVLTPLLYVVRALVVRLLGRDEAARLAHAAHPADPR